MKLEIKRRKSKICNKIGDLFAYVKKKQYLCIRKLRNTNTGERSPIKQSGAGGLSFGSVFLYSALSFLGGKIARLFFSN